MTPASGDDASREARGLPPDPSIRSALRLMVLTCPEPACGRPLDEVVGECLEAGATAIQLRDKTAAGGALFETARRLATVAHGAGALLLVNDRLDVALASGADGAHLGPADLPIARARPLAPRPFILGFSTDDPDRAARAARAGADYLGVGSVFPTASKEGLAGEAVGPERVRALREAAGIPAVGIGGVTPENAGAVARAGDGVAVLGAVMDAPQPGDAVRALLAAMDA
ncbi:MAG: thiamine phosphate synthase [Gemmatimonadota bacterium]